MAWVDELTDSVENILSTAFEERDGNVIPTTSNVTFSQSVKIEGAFLYADLAGSTVLARECPWQTTAKIIRAYLDICSRSIRGYGGEIRSFDGDRVMGIFLGEHPCNDAVQCAREIDWMVTRVLNPKAKEKFTSISSKSLQIKHCVGVDWGIARAVRAGIRGSNDLIWIGEPPSLAAKLSDIREFPYTTIITGKVYNRLWDSNKLEAGSNIWQYSNRTISEKTVLTYRTEKMRVP